MAKRLKNEAVVEQIRSWLSHRKAWERDIAHLDLIRHTEDRPKSRSYPWPLASNFAYALCDMVIDDWKPQLTGSISSKQRLIHFSGLNDEIQAIAEQISWYYNFQIRNCSNYKREMKFAADPFAHLGTAYVKTTWDLKKNKPNFTFIHPLFMIRSPDAGILEEDKAFVHILQKDVDFVRERWGKNGFGADVETLIDKARNGESDDDFDEGQSIERLYERVGIDRTVAKRNKTDNDDPDEPKQDTIILWEYHYTKDGQKRIRTVSPDDDKFNLKDDRAYPYDHGHWMVTEMRREYKEKKANSSRGITQLGAEPQAFLGALIRAVHNMMTLSQAPMYFAKDGLPENISANFDYEPGTVIPYDIGVLQNPSLDASWFEQAQEMREYGERRLKKPDYGLAKDQSAGKDPRTLGELEMIKDSEVNAASGVLDNWDDATHEILWQGFQLNIQFKPKNVAFLQGKKKGMLPQNTWEILEKFQEMYVFSVTSSAEILDKKVRLQAKTQVLQIATQYPQFCSLEQAVQNALQEIDPESVQSVFVGSAQAQASEIQKGLLDIQQIVQAGTPPQPEPGADAGIRASTGIAFLTSPQNVKNLDHQHIGGILQYAAGYAQMLGKKDPQKSAQLIDTIKGIAHGIQAGMQNGSTGNTGQPQQGAQGEPPDPHESITIAYKDLCYEAQRQALAKLGITVTIQDLAGKSQLDLAVEKQKVVTQHQATAADKVVDHTLGQQNRLADHAVGLHGKEVDHAHAKDSAEQAAKLAPKPVNGTAK